MKTPLSKQLKSGCCACNDVSRFSIFGRKFAYSCWGIAAALVAAFQVATTVGLTINTTESLPLGLWRLLRADAPIRRGVVVIASPPENRSHAELRQWGYERSPLLKPIAAVPGDRVEVTQSGISVNGELLLNSAQLNQDGEGHILPKVAYGWYVVEPGTVWLISNYNPLSLDSRYFGPVPIASIGAQAVPLWIRRGHPYAPG